MNMGSEEEQSRDRRRSYSGEGFGFRKEERREAFLST